MNTQIKIDFQNIDWFDYYLKMPPNSIDLILTDIPYGIMDKIKWDMPQNLIDLEASFDHVLKDNGILVLFCNDKLFHEFALRFTKFNTRSFHIWKKSSAMPISHMMPLPDVEFISVFKRVNTKTTSTSFNPLASGVVGNPYIKKSNILECDTRRHIKSSISENKNGKRWIKTIIEANNKPNMKRSERSNHPTQKPESLLRCIIRVYSKENDLILDPFAGSASTLISAYKEGRNSIGFEIDESYFAEAQSRINNINNQLDIFEDKNE